MKDSIGRDSISRRGFLGRAFSWALASIPIAAMAGMSWRLLSTPFKIKIERKTFLGTLSEITQGINEKRDKKVAIVRDGDDLRAVSLTCTHLGCVMGKSGEGFACPCHGSRFHRDGRVLKGPAARPLDNFRVQVTEDERVFVDMGESA